MTSSASQDLKARAARRDLHRKTGHPGITYRQTARGRSYFVYDGSQRKLGRSPYVRAGKTLKAALELPGGDPRSQGSRRADRRREQTDRPRGGRSVVRGGAVRLA